MTLQAIVAALGGDLYDRGRRANVPAPGHSRADRSVSLLLSEGRVVAHSFGGAHWREVLDDLRARALIDTAGTSASVVRAAGGTEAKPPRQSERLAVARALWTNGLPITGGTASARHVAHRHVLRPLPGPDGLRHHPAAPLSVYRPGRAVRPALMAAVTDREGGFTAIELTYLSPGGLRAVGLRFPRKTVGLVPAGSAVRLDPVGPELLVGEGVFTTLSASERFALPAWALLSTGNLRGWRAPDGVRRVLIAADRGRDGLRSAHVLASRLRRSGVTVAVKPPPAPFGDWNDAARATAGEGEGSEGGRGRAGTGGWPSPADAGEP